MARLRPVKAAGAFPPQAHDHAMCVADALSLAVERCARRGARLTEVRRRVLELVWNSHRPIGAYDLLAALAKEGRNAAPPTVYRALDFLIEQGLVHRIESLNAFIGCAAPGHAGSLEILICTECGNAAELDVKRIAGAIAAKADSLGFEISRQTIEVLGRCRACSALASGRGRSARAG